MVSATYLFNPWFDAQLTPHSASLGLCHPHGLANLQVRESSLLGQPQQLRIHVVPVV